MSTAQHTRRTGILRERLGHSDQTDRKTEKNSRKNRAAFIFRVVRIEKSGQRKRRKIDE